MKKLIIPFLLLASPAFGQTIPTDSAHLTWTNATQNTDNTPIPATGPKSLKFTRVQRSVGCTTTTFGTVAEQFDLAVSMADFMFAGLRPAGKHCFKLAHVLEDDTVGSFGSVVSKQITIPQPPKAKPPTYTIQ